LINIILTLDYEIFGDGTGDVKKHMVKPTERIINVCNKHKVPLVVMLDVVEYMKFIEYDEWLCNDLEYSPARLIEDQIKKIFSEGHDVQLHIHHQWADAEYKNKHWMIKNWDESIAKLSEREISDLIYLAKSQLEDLLRKIRPNYFCTSLRLTNLPWIEAPLVTHQPMIKNGIKIHSLSISESEKNNERGYWALDSEGKLFEFPIHSRCVPFYRMISVNRIVNELYRRGYSFFKRVKLQNEQKAKKDTTLSAVWSVKDGYHLKWDFCKLSARKMIELLKNGLDQYDTHHNEVPLVAIGHSKDIFSEKQLERFIVLAQEKFVRKGLARFTTFGDYVKNNLE